MIEPVDEKEARSDHHTRQGLRKPGDRAKKFNYKNTPKPKQLQHTSSSTGSINRTHGKRVDFIAVESPSPSLKARSPSYGMMGKGSMNEFGAEMDDDGEDVDEEEDEYEYEQEQRERAIMVMEGAQSGTGTLTRGVDGIVLDETREAATTVPIEELLASAYANKRSKKSKADQFDHIRGFGKQHASMAPKSVKSSRSRRQFPHEDEQDSDWESVGQDGTEAWEYNSEWRAEMGNIMGETLPNKTSYREAAMAGVVSVDGSFESESGATEKTDDLP